MADKDFKVKNKLFVNGLSQNSGVILATNNNLDSHTNVPTQYGGTGTTQSPNAGQVLYSSAGTNYAPTDLSSLTISSSGGSTITAASASTKGLIIKGAASQTANLQEWQDSNGSIIARIDSNGISWGNSTLSSAYGQLFLRDATDYGGAANISTGYAGTKGVVIRAYASQTANLQEWQNSSGTALARIRANGNTVLIGALTVNQSNTFEVGDNYGIGSFEVKGTSFMIPRAATGIGLIIRGFNSQSANLQEWQNNAGSVLSSITSNGYLAVGGATTGSFTSLATVRAGGSSQVGVAIGTEAGTSSDALRIFNATGGTILTTIKNTGEITAPLATFTANATSVIPLTVKAIASQTADLQQWQNSAGTVLAKVRASGQLNVGGSVAATTLGVLNIDPAWTALKVIGAASQTGNLQEWQNSAGTILAKVDSAGSINAVGLSLTSTVSGTMFSVEPTYGGITSRGGAVGFSGAASLNIGTNYTGQSAIVASGFAGQSVSTVIIKSVASQTSNLTEWQNSSGTVLASISAAGNLTVQDLTVNGTTTTINSTTLTVDDKNIELASVASPTDTTADGAGITIKGATDKTFNWVQSTGAFTSSEPISTPALSVSGNSVSSNITLAAGKRYFVDTTSARTLTLPASPSLGDEIKIFDASGTAATNNITVARNGNKINGITDDAIIDVNQSSSVFVYTGATVGWRFD